MPLSSDTSSSSFTALIGAGALLLSLACGGIWSVQQVGMAPSAVPPDMAVASEGPRSGLSADTHSELRWVGSGPIWKEISAEQRRILQPLESRWSSMSELTKRRWLVLADRYPQLDAHEQAKFQTRMITWSSLSAQQRNQARFNFATAKRLSANDLQAKWDAYQALSEDEKKRLAAQAAKAKAKGAATAIKPTRRKLARIPAAATAPANEANLPKIPRVVPPLPPIPLPANARPAETVPVFTPKAAPVVQLPPLHSSLPATAAPAPEPTASSQPVQVPRAAPSMDLPPLDSPFPPAVPVPAAPPIDSSTAAPVPLHSLPPVHAAP